MLYCNVIGGCLLALAANGQTVIENFEYADDSAMLAEWTAGGTTIGLSSYIASGATGTNSLRVDLSYAAAAWDARILTKAVLATPVAIGTNQFVTLRVAGDPQFTNASFRTLYVYAHDAAGNFGRWGSPVPTTSSWQIFNLSAAGIEKPWNSPGLPDLSNVVQFQIVIYGQGDPPGNAFDATVYLDDLVVRDTPLLPPSSSGERVIADFEYASDAELAANWAPLAGTISLSSYVSPNSKGTNSLRVDRDFAASAWETEVITGPSLSAPIAVQSTQWITFRISGDPRLTNASWQTLYVYAFDGSGNFGRWGTSIPTTTNWRAVSLLASTVNKPWNSPGLPNLNNIVQFSFYIYGQGDPAGEAYSTTIYVDDLTVRDTALVEFPSPSAMRSLIDDFEGYASDAALMSFYGYVNSPAATATAASLVSPAPQGSKALKLAVDFSSGRYPWGSIRSAFVDPFSIPTNAVVQFRFKGDPTLASVADDATSFWLTFYDQDGNSFNYTSSADLATSADWVTVNANYSDFWATSSVDTGNLVRWRILVQGWNGTDESPAVSGAFYVDEIKVTVTATVPTVAIVRDGSALKLELGNLVPGTTYTVHQTGDLSTWTTATTIVAASQTATWTIPAAQKGFFRVSYAP